MASSPGLFRPENGKSKDTGGVAAEVKELKEREGKSGRS
jgi:hypothetical protein